MDLEVIKKGYKIILFLGVIAFLIFVFNTDLSNQRSVVENLTLTLLGWIAASFGALHYLDDSKKDGVDNPEKDWGIAVLASTFVPGLGQMYCRQFRRGLIILIVVIIGVLVGNFPIGIIGTIFGPIIIIFWIWNIYDAYKLANETTSIKK